MTSHPITFALDHPDRSPAVGARIELTPSRRHVDGTRVVATTPPIVVEMVGDEVVREIPESGADWCWQAREFVRGVTAHVRHVRIDGPAAYAELQDVDPDTLEPGAEPDALWDLALGELAGRVDGLESDRVTRDDLAALVTRPELEQTIESIPAGVTPDDLAPLATRDELVEALSGLGIPDVDGLADALADRITLAQYTDLFLTFLMPILDTKPTLDGNGRIPSSTLPDLAISQFMGSVPNAENMSVLGGQRGDWCIRTDESKSYIRTAEGPGVSSWTALAYPASLVLAALGASTPGQAVAANDPRLTDARNPTAHTHSWPDITDKPAVIAAGATVSAARSAIQAASTGDVTAITSRFIRGSGIPEGSQSALPGSLYVDSAQTRGASLWVKKAGSGSGNTGWQVLNGDTGRVDLTPWLVAPFNAGPETSWISRTGDEVTLVLSVRQQTGETITGPVKVLDIPPGFEIDVSGAANYLPGGYGNGLATATKNTITAQGNWASGAAVRYQWRFRVHPDAGAWPASLTPVPTP